MKAVGLYADTARHRRKQARKLDFRQLMINSVFFFFL